MSHRYSWRFALALTALALPGLAHAQAPSDLDDPPAPAAPASAPAEQPKNALGALGLAVAGTGAGFGLILLDDDMTFVLPVTGIALVLVGPSLGHFYAGEIKTGLIHGGLRVGAFAMAWGGLAWGLHDCDLLFGSCPDRPAAGILFLTGLAGGTAMAVYDFYDAPRAARRHNAKLRQIVLTPAPLAGPDHSAGFGLHLSGRF